MATSPDFKRDYDADVAELKRTHASEDEALRNAIGGEFVAVGRLECALVFDAGLPPDGVIVDVGCGSGRLAHPLSRVLKGRYRGFDIVPDLVDHARKIANRPDWEFAVTSGTVIPVADASADVVCFFSVFTHLLHEETYRYLAEAKRVLKPGGRIVFSFLEFAITCHWDVFQHNLDVPLGATRVHNQFMSRDGIQAFAHRLGLGVRVMFDGDKPHIPLPEPVRWDNGTVMAGMGNLGQSVAILHKP